MTFNSHTSLQFWMTKTGQRGVCVGGGVSFHVVLYVNIDIHSYIKHFLNTDREEVKYGICERLQ